MTNTPVQSATSSQRAEALNLEVARLISKGWSVQSKSEFQAILARGSKTNHVLHLVLSLVTFGFWILVWVGLAVGNAMSRETKTVTITERGEWVVT